MLPQSALPVSSSVRIPGSTSNLGPGFDLLGLALSVYLDVRLTPGSAASATHTLERDGAFADEAALSTGDRVLEAFDLAAERLGVEGHFHFELQHGIPIGRGFGSSGAATAAGLLLAAARAPRSISPHELLTWGIELEGHPDNVTASLFAGCTICHPDPDGQGPAWYAAPVDSSIHVALAWPAEPLETARARASLPDRVSFADAVENPRRLALLLQGLRDADPRLLASGGEDRLHVARRLELIDGAAQAMQAGRDKGAWLVTISGAGSGLVALAAQDRIGDVADAMGAGFRAATGAGEARVVQVVRSAPTVG